MVGTCVGAVVGGALSQPSEASPFLSVYPDVHVTFVHVGAAGLAVLLQGTAQLEAAGISLKSFTYIFAPNICAPV